MTRRDDNAQTPPGPVAASKPRGDVLAAVFELRHRALLQSSARTSAARARHGAFLASSASYREACELGDARLGDERADCATIGGVRWWVPPDIRRENGFADRVLRKRWLPFTDILQTRALAVGTVMLDLGANIGTTAIPRAVLGDFQWIYAAEPEPVNYNFLVHNLLMNGLAGFILPERVAIGSVDGPQPLHVSSKMTGHMLATNLPASSVSPRVTVQCRTLDTWVREHGIDLFDVAFIKCDTQGWEGHILRGASEVLRHKHIAWQLELSLSGLRKSGIEPDEVCDLIGAHFTHFIDLSAGSTSRGGSRSIVELRADVTQRPEGSPIPEVLVYNAAT